jgi:Tol biopolymer transport system component
MMPVTGGTPKVIAYLYGGQGTINTPSWSPDSKKVAFISNTSDISIMSLLLQEAENSNCRI